MNLLIKASIIKLENLQVTGSFKSRGALNKVLSLSKEESAKTFYQQKIDKKEKLLNNEKNSKVFKEMSEIFSDADLVDVRTEDE